MHFTDIIGLVRQQQARAFRPRYQHKPDDCDDALLALMEHCWAEEAADRPNFSDVIKVIIKVNSGKYVQVHEASTRVVTPTEIENLTGP